MAHSYRCFSLPEQKSALGASVASWSNALQQLTKDLARSHRSLVLAWSSRHQPLAVSAVLAPAVRSEHPPCRVLPQGSGCALNEPALLLQAAQRCGAGSRRMRSSGDHQLKKLSLPGV
jgi:hypothetical protein